MIFRGKGDPSVTDMQGKTAADGPIPMLWQFRMADRFGWPAIEGWDRLPAQAQEMLQLIQGALDAIPTP